MTMQDVQERYKCTSKEIKELQQRKRFERIREQLQIRRINNYREILDTSYDYNYHDNLPLELKQRDIEHMMVNAIRHRFSNYISCIYKIDHIYAYPNNKNYTMFKNYTLECIAKEYPFLQNACIQQKRSINMVKICDV